MQKKVTKIVEFFQAYCKWATCLYIQSQFAECVKVADYAFNMFPKAETDDPVKYKALQQIKVEAINACK